MFDLGVRLRTSMRGTVIRNTLNMRKWVVIHKGCECCRAENSAED